MTKLPKPPLADEPDPILHHYIYSWIKKHNPQPGNVDMFNMTPIDKYGHRVGNNTQGWRSPHNFDCVNWKDAVLVFGCSHVWGQALAYEDSLCAQLERKINRPVINLGIMGAGPKFAIETAIQLKNIYGIHLVDRRPKAVIHVWSHYLRRHYQIDGLNRVRQSHIIDYEPDTPVTLEQLNWEAQLFWDNWKYLWPEPTQQLNYTFFSDSGKMYNLPVVTQLDWASDNAHYGPLTHAALAEKIATDFLKNT